jgi:hypothetical protein
VCRAESLEDPMKTNASSESRVTRGNPEQQHAESINTIEIAVSFNRSTLGGPYGSY